ncbi:MAG TPA: tRNA uridine-5-carboxymethylaminomethyl(34) synthesis enzyme MnmG [Pyrinomonadaceae bacterium]|jgi:tRNA uridine 5-carboxymethylaminomethyl modification enzyme|nr:tRNA uridine-5-carboxymethylaminomethyl(34) synthesis enzyme MnmG [Pyrinomonadaceae bacterium]
MSFDEVFDVIVIGAGHAGCEAASAAARLGSQTALVTLSLDMIGQMSCNPAVGGIAKGHLVREIDALGGIMGRVIDRTGIQFRLLNRSRGPAVQSPRAQADRALYRTEMRHTLEATPNLHLRQGLVIDLIVKDGQVRGVELQDTRRFGAGAVIIATGTFLNGLIHTGKRTYTAGRAGEPASTELAESLKRLGFPVGRLKTGTPPRLDGRTIDWEAFEPQPADQQPVPFSFSTDEIPQPQITCFIGYTTEDVHQSIRTNIHESPLYSGQIKGVGPRYCPSIEDKVVKFPDKTRHQLFLEPEGHDTYEVYLNGFSTSLPAELQQELVHKVPGLDEAKIIRPGYAIEYDFIDPRELTPFLQTTRFQGLFLAGQINGTTGYEEAACQGLIAGVNASMYVQGRDLLRLRRENSYIGVLVDDLITHGVDEPYRMFTSRAEHRLSLRYDTADSRLSPVGREIGLVGDDEWERFNLRRQNISQLRMALETTRFKRSEPQYHDLARLVGKDLGDSVSLGQISLYPQIPSSSVLEFLPPPVKATTSLRELETALADLLYHGYIKNQTQSLERIFSHDRFPIPGHFDYRQVNGLSHEMIERLERTRPETFGQARKIPGLTPAAISLLLFSLKAHKAA